MIEYCLVIGAIIVTTLTTFVGNFASAQNATTSSWIGEVGNMTALQNGGNETEPPQSITIGGLSAQGADDLAIACSFFQERC